MVKVEDIFSRLVALILTVFVLFTIKGFSEEDKYLFESSTAHSSVASTYDIQNERVRRIVESDGFIEFNQWLERFKNNPLKDNIEQIELGETLADKRLELLKELIKISPESALRVSIQESKRRFLPQSIINKLEKKFSGNGDFFVYVADNIDHFTGNSKGSQTIREIILDGKKYQAFVYGRRESMTTKINIPMHGIFVDDLMAVDENPVRKIEADEYDLRKIDVYKLGTKGVAIESAGKIIYFENQVKLDSFVKEQIEWELKIEPKYRNREDKFNEPISTWTTGNKKVLFMRVDFSDRPGDPVDLEEVPITLSRIQEMMNQANSFYINNSYNKTSLQTTVTPILRMPNPQSYYQSNNIFNALLTDARNAARAAGFETNNFDLDVVLFSYRSEINFGGLGSLGGKGAVINGGYRDYYNVIVHELGHNYGLNHANLWRATDGTVIGPGFNREYGNGFDMMGFGEFAQHNFNASYKLQLNWLDNVNVQTIVASGIYRVYAQDSLNSSGIHLLRVRKDANKNYDIEFRQLITNNPRIMNGAVVHWYYPQQKLTQLLDMTPETNSTTIANDMWDAPLIIGQSFVDNVSGIRITVLNKGNTIPESLDIRVELNPAVSQRRLFDFDGDGKSDISVFRPSNGAWYLNQSTVGFTGLAFGIASDKLVPADYDGDGITDVAVYRGGNWYLQRSSQGFTGIAFGDGNDIPVPADYDGDGKAEIAVFRPSNGYWYMLNLVSNQFTATPFGVSTDRPVPADYDGDGKTDVAVNRNGNWYIQRSQLGFTGIQFGDGNDKTVPADYDGDGKVDVAVFRPSNGYWYLNRSAQGFTGLPFGLGTDLPVPADYDGDGKADVAVVRNGNWYIQQTQSGFTGVAFGTGDDRPIPNSFVR